MNTFKFLIAGIVLAFGTAASAATTIDTPVIFEFDGAGGFGSTLTDDGNGNIVGADINIDTIFVTAPDGVRTSYDVDAGYLNFDTTGTGSLSIVGSVGSIFGTTGFNSITIFSGNVDGTLDTSGTFNVFTGTGGGGVDPTILSTLGMDNGAFEFFAFTLGFDNAGVITTDITATQGARGLTPTVPIPAAAWLFGSGLLGLVGVARRKV